MNSTDYQIDWLIMEENRAVNNHWKTLNNSWWYGIHWNWWKRWGKKREWLEMHWKKKLKKWRKWRKDDHAIDWSTRNEAISNQSTRHETSSYLDCLQHRNSSSRISQKSPKIKKNQNSRDPALENYRFDLESIIKFDSTSMAAIGSHQIDSSRNIDQWTIKIAIDS